jgi:hypothetical protein
VTDALDDGFPAMPVRVMELIGCRFRGQNTAFKEGLKSFTPERGTVNPEPLNLGTNTSQ